MYTIGKLSKNTGITVRTLDYYDEIGLIKPSSKTDGGYRLYSEDDVMKLERILALKYMGFSLDQIKEILKSSPLEWQESIRHQLEMVKLEQERLKTLEQALRGVSYSIEFEGKVNWAVIFGAIHLLQQDPGDALDQYKKYLSEEEMKKIMDVNKQLCEEDMKEWMAVNFDIKDNLELDPGSEKAWQLAERWGSQAEKMFGGDDELLGDMWEALQHLKDGVAFYPMDKDIIEFIECAFTAKYKVKNTE